jgi:hypothetical protein
MSETQSEFLAWFEAQHGKRMPDRVPEGSMMRMSDDELKDAIFAGKSAADILAAREKWDARKESALYAWQASSNRT